MALVSDQRVAHPGIKMGQPEINAGISSIMGFYWMSLHLSYSKNQEFSITGRLMEVEEATSLGLINQLVARYQVVAKACEVASCFLRGRLSPGSAPRRGSVKLRWLNLTRPFALVFSACAKVEPQAVIDTFLGKKNQ
jgi:enoyl-CoA hydratase/carnithine racemase